EGVAAEGEGRDVLDPLRAARELEVVHEDVEDEDERDRDERQIVAARLEDRHEENRAHEDGRPWPDQHGEPRRPAPRDGQEADRVAAEAGERGAGEVDDAGGPDTREVAAHTRSTLFSPRMPLGLNTRNTMTTANATTSRNSEPRGMRAAAVVWRTPKSRPPMIAP